MMRWFGRVGQLIVFVAFGLLILEVLYRGYLRVEYPARFTNPPADQLFTTWDTPMWRYSDRFGYDYVPAQDVTQAVMQNSHVVLCETEKYVNEQGNIGPGVSDYDRATYKILVFGDSFSASALNGQTWPSILQAKLEEVTKRWVRVLNLARDGYGVLQMFELAAAKVPELKPDLVVFAFNASALSRARSWRVLVGRGDDVRFVTTTQNSEIPPLDLSTDFALIAPAATRQWCANMLRQSPQAQEGDPVLINILRKRRYIEGENGPMAIASVYDVRTSYVYDRLIHGDPFFSQWRRLRPGTNPMVSFTDFSVDHRFVADLEGLNRLNVPYIIVNLPLGVSIKNNQEFWFDGDSEALLKSLEKTTGKTVVRLRPYLNVSPKDAMKLCLSVDDCHPSKYGMQAYASAVARVASPILSGLAAR